MRSSSLGFRLLQWYGLRGKHPGQWRVHAALRNVLQVGVDEDLAVERQGLRWVLNPSDTPQVDLFWLGESDRWDLFHARSFLRPGAVIFDVGANFGYYALVLAEGLQRRCEVHAFEPTPATFRRLGEHIALNGMGDVVHAHQLALSDEPGRASMCQPRSGNSGAAYAELGSGEVPVSTLDSFVRERTLSRLDFVKIDVEGFEERVLRGGVHTLRTLRPVLLLEVQPVTLQRAGSSVARIFELLQTMGYVLRRAQKERLIPLEASEVSTPGSLVNGFALPAR